MVGIHWCPGVEADPRRLYQQHIREAMDLLDRVGQKLADARLYAQLWLDVAVYRYARGEAGLDELREAVAAYRIANEALEQVVHLAMRLAKGEKEKETIPPEDLPIVLRMRLEEVREGREPGLPLVEEYYEEVIERLGRLGRGGQRG